jgi:hypothetical protein
MHIIRLICQLRVPSGSSINLDLLVTDDGYSMNIEVDVPAVYKVEGLCGTADGDSTNEMKIRGQSTYKSLIDGQFVKQVPEEVATSWKYEIVCATILSQFLCIRLFNISLTFSD